MVVSDILHETIYCRSINQSFISDNNNNNQGTSGGNNFNNNNQFQQGGSNQQFSASNSGDSTSDMDCQVSIVLVVASGADDARAISTINPMPLTAQMTTLSLADGSVDPTWTHVYPFYMMERPSTIDVVAMHTGTLRYRNGSWPYRNTKYTAVMDTFKLSMNGKQPTQGGSLSGYTLTGGEVRTQLQVG